MFAGLARCAQQPNVSSGPQQHPKPPHRRVARWPTNADEQPLPRLRACPDTSVCPRRPVTIFVYQGAKEDAAYGNLFYSMAVNALLYARHKGYVPLIRFEPSWVYKTMGQAWRGSGGNGSLWETFFEPYCANVSAWQLACPNVTTATKKLSFYYPDVQRRYLWSVRSWYNVGSPEFAQQCGLDKVMKSTCWRFNETIYRSWRLHGHAIVSRSHRLNAGYAAEVAARWRDFNPDGVQPILGLHMRGSDKRSGRRKVYPCVFEPYVVDFFARFPSGRVYVATESSSYSSYVRSHWEPRWPGRVFVPSIVTRVGAKVPNFKAPSEKQLRVAHDVFIDIQMLSRADYFIHGASAVAEAVIYTSPALHWRSTHLEYDAVCSHNATCWDAPWRWEYAELPD